MKGDRILTLDEVLNAVERCKRGGQPEEVNADKLIRILDTFAKKPNNGKPNNLDEILANGRKALAAGKEYARTITELAEAFGVERKTLYNWQRIYGFPAFIDLVGKRRGYEIAKAIKTLEAMK